MLSVGEILKKQREKLGLELKDIEKAIKARIKFLTAVEENNWKIFSSKIYISGIIKNYSRYLGLNSSNALAFFRRDYEKLESINFKRRLAGSYFTPETRKIFITIIILIFLVFFAYFGFQLKQYFSPAKVSILAPEGDTFKKKESVKILGKTEKDATITVFGERIFQNSDGLFEYVFPLKPGENELAIEVVGANGRKSVFKKKFIRKE